MSSKRYAILGSVAGAGAVRIREAAEALFAAKGKELLSESARQRLQSAMVQNSAHLVNTLAPDLALGVREVVKVIGEQSSTQAGALVVDETAKQVARAAFTKGAPAGGVLARATIKVAGKEVLKGAAASAGIGFVIDGAFGGYEGVMAYRRGEMTKQQAIAHTAKEASTGAVATGIGVLLAAGLVAVTGGAAAPAVFAVGAGGAIGSKQILRKLVDGVAARTSMLPGPTLLPEGG
jgi:hypothetical protein